MSFRSLFSSKGKKDKHKQKPLLTAQQLYDLGDHYLQKFSQISNKSLSDQNNAVVIFFKELYANENASSYRAAIRAEFAKAYCAENIDFLFNYFELGSTFTREQWKAFYYQYVEEDKDNRLIDFTGINIDDAQQALFSELNNKIIHGEKDGRGFLDYMAEVIAGHILGRDELVVAAIAELQQKAVSNGAVSPSRPSRF